MLHRNSFVGLILLLSGILAGTTPVHAVTSGTAAANSALNFDPFSTTSVQSAAAATAAGTVTPKVTTTVPSGTVVVIPGTLPVPRTPGDPPTVYLSVGDSPTVIQSATLKTYATFKITLSAQAMFAVTFSYATSDGTATANLDYISQQGTITFAPGQTVAYVTVTVLPEPGETKIQQFYLNIGAQSGANVTSAVVQISRPQGVAIIQPPVIDIWIGNAGTIQQSKTAYTYAYFPVTLSAPATTTITVHYKTSDGTAIQNLDYIPANSTISFSPGQTSATIKITILPENKVPNGIFYVTISSPSGAPGVTIVNAKGQAEIRGQNSEIFVAGDTFARPSVTTNEYVRVYLDKASTQTISVKFMTVDGTAKANIDYKAVSTTVTFAPGQFTKSIAIPIIGIPGHVVTRSFTVEISNPATGNGWAEVLTSTVTITGH